MRNICTGRCTSKVCWHGFLTFPSISIPAAQDTLPEDGIQVPRDSIDYSAPATPELLLQQKIINNRTSHATSGEVWNLNSRAWVCVVKICSAHKILFSISACPLILSFGSLSLYLCHSLGPVSVRFLRPPVYSPPPPTSFENAQA